MSFGKTNYRHGGTRGGQDQFKWDDVKNDKYRENYLGHSVNAPVGRWQKGKDLTWYAKASKQDKAAALREELALARERDEELMNQALGIAPKKRVATEAHQLDAAEVKELLKRGASEGAQGERVEGLGAAPLPPGAQTGPKKTLAERYLESLANGKTDDTYKLQGTVTENDGDARAREEKEKKEKKKSKKKEKKAKKERKKERRHGREQRERGRRRSRSRSRSLSRSVSSDRLRSASRSPPPRARPEAHNHARSRSRSRSPARHAARDNRRPSRQDTGRSRSRSRTRPTGRGRSRSRSRSAEQRRDDAVRTRRRSRSRSYSPRRR